MILANLVVENTDIIRNPVCRLSVWIHHALTPPIVVIIVEGVPSRICTQDVDSGAWTQ